MGQYRTQQDASDPSIEKVNEEDERKERERVVKNEDDEGKDRYSSKDEDRKDDLPLYRHKSENHDGDHPLSCNDSGYDRSNISSLPVEHKLLSQRGTEALDLDYGSPEIYPRSGMDCDPDTNSHLVSIPSHLNSC